MIIGLTATRLGMSDAQKHAFREALLALGATQLDHGDCVGGDADGHAIAKTLGLRIGIHPPINESDRAFCQGADITYPAQTYLARNRTIVHVTATLIGAPAFLEPLPSVKHAGGTWYTIRYARKLGKPCIVLDR